MMRLICIREVTDKSRGEGLDRKWTFSGHRWVRPEEVRQVVEFQCDEWPQHWLVRQVEIAGPHGTNYWFWTDEPANEIANKVRV